MLFSITWVVAKCQAHNLIFFIWWMIHQGVIVCESMPQKKKERNRLGDETNDPHYIIK